MLFGFRGIRGLQVLTALVSAACGVGAVLAVDAYAGDGGVFALVPALILGLVFLWMFSVTMRLPTSFVAVAEERTRIRFGGFVDTVVANRDIIGASLVRHPWWGGLGVRTNFGGTVALATAWGEVAELQLQNPVRIWLIPRLWPIRATRLRVSVRHPAKLVERFGTSAVGKGSARNRR